MQNLALRRRSQGCVKHDHPNSWLISSPELLRAPFEARGKDDAKDGPHRSTQARSKLKLHAHDRHPQVGDDTWHLEPVSFPRDGALVLGLLQDLCSPAFQTQCAASIAMSLLRSYPTPIEAEAVHSCLCCNVQFLGKGAHANQEIISRLLVPGGCVFLGESRIFRGDGPNGARDGSSGSA